MDSRSRLADNNKLELTFVHELQMVNLLVMRSAQHIHSLLFIANRQVAVLVIGLLTLATSGFSSLKLRDFDLS